MSRIKGETYITDSFFLFICNQIRKLSYLINTIITYITLITTTITKR